jgi:hypothetical protein
MVIVYTYVCTRCCAGWTISAEILRSKVRCERCGRVDKVELRGCYGRVSLNAKDAP